MGKEQRLTGNLLSRNLDVELKRLLWPDSQTAGICWAMNFRAQGREEEEMQHFCCMGTSTVPTTGISLCCLCAQHHGTTVPP